MSNVSSQEAKSNIFTQATKAARNYKKQIRSSDFCQFHMDTLELRVFALSTENPIYNLNLLAKTETLILSTEWL